MPKIRKRSTTKGEDITQTDEFLSLSDKVAEFVMANTKQVLTGLGIVAVVISVAAGVYYWNEAKKNKSAYLLFQASRHMQAAEAQDDSAKAETDLSSARSIYQNIVKDYDGSADALTAHYELGNIDSYEGKWDDALKEYETVTAKGGDTVIVLSAKQRIAYAKWAKGDKEGALKDFDQLMSANGAPKDLLHLEKGRLLEELGRKEEAQKEYNEIIAEYKESPFVGEATRRYMALGGQLPKPEASLPAPAVKATAPTGAKPSKAPVDKK